MFGGGNDKLFGVLCDRLGFSEWKTDARFVTNSDRVQHRAEIDAMIEGTTVQRTTQEWLDIFEGSGMPYAAVNDIQGTLNHKHGKYYIRFPDDHISNVNSPSTRHGNRDRAPCMWTDQACQYAC